MPELPTVNCLFPKKFHEGKIFGFSRRESGDNLKWTLKIQNVNLTHLAMDGSRIGFFGFHKRQENFLQAEWITNFLRKTMLHKVGLAYKSMLIWT